MKVGYGFCEKCQGMMLRNELACDICGARLPWADELAPAPTAKSVLGRGKSSLETEAAKNNQSIIPPAATSSVQNLFSGFAESSSHVPKIVAGVLLVAMLAFGYKTFRPKTVFERAQAEYEAKVARGEKIEVEPEDIALANAPSGFSAEAPVVENSGGPAMVAAPSAGGGEAVSNSKANLRNVTYFVRGSARRVSVRFSNNGTFQSDTATELPWQRTVAAAPGSDVQMMAKLQSEGSIRISIEVDGRPYGEREAQGVNAVVFSKGRA